MVEGLKRVVVAFYRTSGGQEPVREWIKSLVLEDRRILWTGPAGARIWLADRDAALSPDRFA